MRQGIRPTSTQLACLAFLVLLPLVPACTNSPAPDKPEPARKADTALFSEAEANEWFMGRWSRRLASPFVKFSGLKDGDLVLDVGSGTGSLALAVLQEAPASRLVGIDPSPAYGVYARARVKGSGNTILSYRPQLVMVSSEPPCNHASTNDNDVNGTITP